MSRTKTPTKKKTKRGWRLHTILYCPGCGSERHFYETRYSEPPKRERHWCEECQEYHYDDDPRIVEVNARCGKCMKKYPLTEFD